MAINMPLKARMFRGVPLSKISYAATEQKQPCVFTKILSARKGLYKGSIERKGKYGFVKEGGTCKSILP